MPRVSVEEHLEHAPPAVRRAMLEQRGELEPGAAAVVGRLFRIAAERREPPTMPSAAAFRAAASSEPTFRTLLRALARHAPQISTAAAVAVKHEWVARRTPPRTAADAAAQAAQREDMDAAKVAAWPDAWRAGWPYLQRARVRASTLKRHVASIDRCAHVVAKDRLQSDFGFLLAWELAEALPRHSDRGLRPISVANYLDGLIALGRRGGADDEALAGMRLVVEHLRDQAASSDKLKLGRLAELMERGGFAHVADRIGELRGEAFDHPPHAARRIRLLQQAVLCAVEINKPARTGDISRWRIGEELVRTPAGAWRLEWFQQKTARRTEAGELWPEVGEVLDEHVLGGRPSRFIHHRCRELQGMNWLTLCAETHASDWPSQLIKEAVGVPSHDLRTLAADYQRRHDPETAAEVIATHLGHATRAAGEDYRAETEGDAAALEWQRMREAWPAA